MTMFFEYSWSLLPTQWSYSGSAGLPLRYFQQTNGMAHVSRSSSAHQQQAPSSQQQQTGQQQQTLQHQSQPQQPPQQQMRTHRILNDWELSAGCHAQWNAIEIHGYVSYLGRGIFEMQHLTALFITNNYLTSLPPEINQLTRLAVLDVANNMLQELPVELGDLRTLVHLNISGNKLTSLPPEMGKLFRLKYLNVMGNPLPSELIELAHGPLATRRLQQYLLDSSHMSSEPPPSRAWHAVKPFRAYESLAQINVLCYNVLCDRYATFSQYSYCPTWALDWEYRKTAIIFEIMLYDCDILTLQEVEAEKFDSYFKPELEACGYDGIFAAKTRVRTMTEEDRPHVDGCAVFWRKDKFKLRRQQLVEFGQIAVQKGQKNEAILDRVMSKDNIALIGVLETLPGVHKRSHELPRYTGFETPLFSHGAIAHMPDDESVAGIPIVVCAAHFHWDPEFCDVKLIQTMIMTHECSRQMEQLAEEYKIPFHEVPLILGIDSNSLPDSGVVQYLLNGAVSKTHEDLKGLYPSSTLDPLNSNDYDDHQFRHSIRLTSGINPEAAYATNLTPEFQGMIDYIFVTPQSLERLGYMGAVDSDWVERNDIVGFPHPYVPSDHVPIVCSFALNPIKFRDVLPPVKRARRRSTSSFFDAVHARAAASSPPPPPALPPIPAAPPLPSAVVLQQPPPLKQL